MSTSIQNSLQQLLKSTHAPVVIWHDPQGEFEEEFRGLELSGVKKLAEADLSAFELKDLLNQWPDDQPLLLYRRRERTETSEAIRGDWLADVEQYAVPFEADKVSDLVRELGVPDTPEMRRVLSASRSYLTASVISRVRKLGGHLSTPRDLELAIIASALRAASPSAYSLVIAYLAADGDEADAAVKALERAHQLEGFAEVVAAGINYRGDIQDRQALTTSVLITALLATLDEQDLHGLEAFLLGHSRQDVAVAACSRIVSEWAAGPKRRQLREAAEEVEQAQNLAMRFGQLGAQKLAATGIFPVIDTVVLQELLEGLNAGLTSPANTQALIDQRKPLAWYAEHQRQYEAVEQYAALVDAIARCGRTLSFPSAQAAWESYERELHKPDTAYRKAVPLLDELKIHAEGALEEAAEDALDRADGLYAQYLGALAEAWSKAAGPAYAERGYVPDINRLNEFYLREVDARVRSGGCAVIISDALRYEVAKELARAIDEDFTGDVAITSVQAMYPSVTATGMAALLPHGTYRIHVGSGGLEVLVDGMGTHSAQREAVLKRTEPTAHVFRANDYLQLKAAERKELKRQAKLLYIYQNEIDAIGDNAKSEAKVFDACATAIRSLKELVDVVSRQYPNIVITADHGFLYTRGHLTEADKAQSSLVNGEVVWFDRRALLASAGSTSELLMTMSMRTNGSDALVGFSPRDCSRFKKQGGGANYVHGGTTLQEMCVPVVALRKRRRGSKGYEDVAAVPVEPLGLPSVITNNVLTLKFLQKEPIGGAFKAGRYNLRMLDSQGSRISENVALIADRTSSDARERELACDLMLSAGSTVRLGDTCYLQLVDADDGGKEVGRWPMTYQVAFAAPSDFGW